MDMHAKKKIEIIIEAPALNGVLAILDRLQATGYTVLPALAGSGRHGPWDEAGQVTSAGRMVAVLCILDATRLDPTLDAVSAYLANRIAIVAVSDVQVIRGAHF